MPLLLPPSPPPSLLSLQLKNVLVVGQLPVTLDEAVYLTALQLHIEVRGGYHGYNTNNDVMITDGSRALTIHWSRYSCPWQQQWNSSTSLKVKEEFYRPPEVHVTQWLHQVQTTTEESADNDE